MLAPITHTPPTQGEASIEIPPKVALHLGLDDVRCWIKTLDVNTLTCQKDRIPVGVVPIPTGRKKGEWSYGRLPSKLGKAATDQVLEHVKARQLKTVQRDSSQDAPLAVRKPLSPEERRKQSRDKPKRTR